MIVPKKLTFKNLDNLYLKLNQKDANVLRIPSKLAYQGPLGVHSAFIQFLITWSRIKSQPTLHLYASAADSLKHVGDLASQPFGLIALLMCDRVIAEDHSTVAKRDVEKITSPILKAMYDRDLLRSVVSKGSRPPYIHTLAAQANSYEFVRSFYESDSYGSILPKSNFCRFIDKALQTLLGHSKAAKLGAERIEMLGRLIYELIQNTDEYTITDEKEATYDKGARGVLVTHSKVRTDKVSELVTSEGSYSLHLVKKQIRREDAVETVELSVYDSGPGMARRWQSVHGDTSKELSLAEEIAYVKQCFTKWSTSKNSMGAGIGLHESLQILAALNGFLFIRTGRACLFQSLKPPPKGEEAVFRPEHWHNSNESAAEGTLITVSVAF